MESVITKEENTICENVLIETSLYDISSSFSPKQETFKAENEVNFDKETSFEPIIDYKKYITESFKSRGFISSEKWDKTFNISSKIISYDKQIVVCECLIDKENNIFESRTFPRNLFDHIDDFSKSPYVLLTIKSKIGSTRIDVIRGEGIVNKEAFKLKDNWDRIDSDRFNKPLDKPIEL
ncbi:MAG: hypothetical protein PHT69_16090 [Bacteroidales bacterium]|nr:hypothetical protein [Bacteroidales bacterium]